MATKLPVSISVQISRVVALTALIAVLLTMFAMISVAALLARSAAEQRARTIAELVAASAEVPLVLKDAQSGREALSALSTSDAVLGARLIDASGGILVTYTQSPRTLGESLAADGTDGDLFARVSKTTEATVRHPVQDRGDLLGYAEVTIRERYLSKVLSGFMRSGAAVRALMLLIWTAISGRIGRLLTLPLTRFAEVSRKVRDTGDFTHRVAPTRVLEVQRLSEDFNAMLQVIERRTSEVQERNKELARLAFYDPLTGAANRVLLLDRMTQLIDSHSRNHLPFAVIEFDLDDFKLLNDQLGHRVGDAFLVSMSHRCKAELAPTDTFSRLGGDEFIALLPNVSGREEAFLVARRLAQAVHAANHVQTLPISCTASMGIGVFPEDGQ